MKFSININQYGWSQAGLSGLDIVDLAVLDAIKTFVLSERADSVTHDGKVYYWVSPAMLIEEMPMLGISTTRGMNKRIDNLVASKMLERCPENQSARKTYIRMGARFKDYEYGGGNENASSLGTIVPTQLGTAVPSTIILNNHNTLSIEEKREKFARKCSEYIPQYGEHIVTEFVNYWSESNGKELRCEIARRKSGCFEISRRLATWASKEYNKPTKNSAITTSERKKKTPWEEMGITQSQYESLFRK